jgi:hypothetical protein
MFYYITHSGINSLKILSRLDGTYEAEYTVISNKARPADSSVLPGFALAGWAVKADPNALLTMSAPEVGAKNAAEVDA